MEDKIVKEKSKRNLIRGGIYMYPSTMNNPNGKLRLTYECALLAFLIE